MTDRQAEEDFAEADRLFRERQFEEALAILDDLNTRFPHQHRLLNARAKTLTKCGRYNEALAIYDSLVNEMGYEKAEFPRKRVIEKMESGSEALEPTPGNEFDEIFDAKYQADVDNGDEGESSRIQIKPVRLLILIGLCVGMYLQYVPYWVGGEIIGAYFVVTIALRVLFGRLIMIPFKMKGKALQDAAAEVHGHEWTEQPSGEEYVDLEKEKGPRKFVWLDVTITPKPNDGQFSYWEPSELMVANAGQRIRNPDDLDFCDQVHDVKIHVSGQWQEDEEAKYPGPQRLKLLASVPFDATDLKFVYYFEDFGLFSLEG